MNPEDSEFPDYCKVCRKAEGFHFGQIYPPIGVQAMTKTGATLKYRCKQGHEWTCWWLVETQGSQ